MDTLVYGYEALYTSMGNVIRIVVYFFILLDKASCNFCHCKPLSIGETFYVHVSYRNVDAACDNYPRELTTEQTMSF